MAEPSDLSRLRLGQELREIREKLLMSQYRECFHLASRESVRVGDITQAIFDTDPQIIHFSGHGNNSGELCFESLSGETNPVSPEALNNLFSLVSDQVKCVIINACYSHKQAKAIAEKIPYVVGMKEGIGDQAAIAFSVGFYKALGANKMIEKAFDFGCAEIQMEGLSSHSIPVLYKKPKAPKVLWELTLKTTLDELDTKTLHKVLDAIRNISGDASIEINKIESGSIKLTLSGSDDGFLQISELIESGQLTEIEDIPIQSIKLLISALTAQEISAVSTENPLQNQLALQHQVVTVGAYSKVAFSTPEQESLKKIEIVGLLNILSKQGEDTVAPETINFLQDYIATKILKASRFSSYKFESFKIWTYNTQENEESQGYMLPASEQQAFKIYSPVEESTLDYIAVLDVGLTGNERASWEKTCQELLTPLFMTFVPPPDPPESLKNFLIMRFGPQLVGRLDLFSSMHQNMSFNALIVQAK